jgi:hypothetical protein
MEVRAQEHAKILQSLVDHDPYGAVTGLYQHLSTSVSLVAEGMEPGSTRGGLALPSLADVLAARRPGGPLLVGPAEPDRHANTPEDPPAIKTEPAPNPHANL